MKEGVSEMLKMLKKAGAPKMFYALNILSLFLTHFEIVTLIAPM